MTAEHEQTKPTHDQHAWHAEALQRISDEALAILSGLEALAVLDDCEPLSKLAEASDNYHATMGGAKMLATIALQLRTDAARLERLAGQAEILAKAAP